MKFTGSPYPDIGISGLFKTLPENNNQIAILSKMIK